jgi:hypothetical protein
MTIRVRNVVSIADHLAAQLWRDQGHLQEDDPLRAATEDHAAVVERLCRRAGGSPSDLPPRTRNAYAWLRYVSDPETWPRHIAALRRIREALAPQPKPVGAAEVHLVAMEALWRIRDRDRRHRPLLLRLNQGFMAAGEETLERFAAAWARRDMPTLHRLSRDVSLTGGFLEISEALRALAPEPAAAAAGTHHDLDAAFRRVNAAHFEGRMERPALRWGAVATRRTWGSYRFSEDRVTISPSLDASEVPEWVVDFILFHELLHKEHGLTTKGTRRYAHTATFRGAERAHPRHRDAEDFLIKFARRLRRR